MPPIPTFTVDISLEKKISELARAAVLASVHNEHGNTIEESPFFLVPFTLSDTLHLVVEAIILHPKSEKTIPQEEHERTDG